MEGKDGEGKELEHVIPFGQFYYKIFKDHTIIITGSGRSGTSTIGRLIGSMKHVNYLFEPSVIKFLFDGEPLRALLFEDFYLPLLQGRNVNIDDQTESWTGFTITEKDLRRRWKMQRRIHVVKRLLAHAQFFAMKVTEWQGMRDQMERIFPGVKYVHIIRNGNDVVSSAIKPNWYSDFYNHFSVVDWVEQRQDEKGEWYNIPWFIDVEARTYWKKWNVITRNACAWRSATEVGLVEDSDNWLNVRYEELCAEPEKIDRQLRTFLGVKPSFLSKQHLKAIKAHKRTDYPDITEQIDPVERVKFLDLQKKLGYV